jgi:lipopolysaccharide transport system permease protein
MGLAWSFFNPVLMLVVYTFVFAVIFKSRWGVSSNESRTDFAIALFVGMIVHGVFSETVNRAPTVITSNVNYVKKVVFPLEVLPITALGSALFHALVSTFVLLVADGILNARIPYTIMYFPLLLLPLLLGALGFAWALSALGVFVRDVAQATGIFTTVLMFMSPVFYPTSNLPESFRFWIRLNPLTFIIEQSRDVLIWGRTPDFVGIALACGIGFVLAAIGYWWFQMTRRGFSDVL